MRRLKRLLITVALLTCGAFCMGQEQDLGRLIAAIATVESKLNEKAVSGDCVGYLQIRPILVRECNRILKGQKSGERYTMDDRYDKWKSIEMFYLIQDKYNPSHDMEKAIRIWNVGPFAKTRPREYIDKVMAEYGKLE